jgi:hypothetical protein
LLAAAILLPSFLAGCGRAEVYVGWMASNRPGHMRAFYAAFTGSKVRTVQAGSGETLAVEYGATVDQGTLTVSLEDPAGSIPWSVTLDKDVEDAVTLRLEQPGQYALVVRGDGTAGSFHLTWRVE